MARAPNQLTSFLNMGADLQPRLWQLRHNTGNFTKIGPFGETVPVKMQQNQLVIGQFPTKLNRELIRAEQGIY